MKNPKKYIEIYHFPIRYRIFEQPVSSSHQYALEYDWAENLKNCNFFVLFAPKQTDGIGSHGRKWISNKEDFHINLIFYADQILPFSQIAAYTACQLLERDTMQINRFKIRWPNDIMVKDFDGCFKKIGGCLTTVRNEGTRFWVTVGVGINYNLEDFSDIDQPTASVKSFLNLLCEKSQLYERKGQLHFERFENDFTKDELFQSIRDFVKLWTKNILLIQQNSLSAFYGEDDPTYSFSSKHYWLYCGQKVTIFDEDKQKSLTGWFEKLTDDGALQLICDDGYTEIVFNGTGLKLEADMDAIRRISMVSS